MWSANITTCRLSAMSLACGNSLQYNMYPNEFVGNHISYMKSFGLKTDNLYGKFLSFNWTENLHKSPYKHCFIASSFDRATKPLPALFTRILSAIKRKLSISHQLYTVAQVSMKCGFFKTALDCW